MSETEDLLVDIPETKDPIRMKQRILFDKFKGVVWVNYCFY